MMVNLKIRDFENRLIKMIDGEEFPIEIKKLVVGDIYHKLLDVADREVSSELRKASEQEEEVEEKEDEL